MNYAETTENRSTTLVINPPGLIPEFNALGNHPEDMGDYVDDHIQGAYERLGLIDEYPEDRATLLGALENLAEKPQRFTGHHIPTDETKPVLDVFIKMAIDVEKSNFEGKENFDIALQLTREGKNVLIVQNHTSPIDALLPLAMVKKTYGNLPISIVMSQVFEYARGTNLMTSGVEKFPVFQPKHIARFKDNPKVVTEMCRQNATTLRSLTSHAREGGKMIFLYPEKNRNAKQMGVAEPGAMAVPDLLSKTGHELYILPTFVDGLDSVFPNSPGRNELDDFFEILRKGKGTFYCGKPIKYSDIKKVSDSLSEEEQAKIELKVTDKDTEKDRKTRRKAVLSAIILGEIARISPEKNMTGVYSDDDIQALVRKAG